MKYPSALKVIFPGLLSLMLLSCSPRIENVKLASAKVYGNCATCKKTIESAANVKGAVQSSWDADTQVLSLTYDSMKSTLDDILKRVAYAGYDNEKFRAPEDAYAKLEACCKYDRQGTVQKPEPGTPVVVTKGPDTMDVVTEGPDTMVKPVGNPGAIDPLGEVYKAYFAVKDALVKSDGKAASTAADGLSKAISAVKKEGLNAEQLGTWTKYQPLLSLDAEHINGTKETEHQRSHFSALSESMYAVMQVFRPAAKVYLDHCPMYDDGKGADWLSLDKEIKNPYYGSQMLTCGSVKTTIQ